MWPGPGPGTACVLACWLSAQQTGGLFLVGINLGSKLLQTGKLHLISDLVTEEDLYFLAVDVA